MWLSREIGVTPVPGSSFFREVVVEGSSLVRFVFCKTDDILLEAARRLRSLSSSPPAPSATSAGARDQKRAAAVTHPHDRLMMTPPTARPLAVVTGASAGIGRVFCRAPGRSRLRPSGGRTGRQSSGGGETGAGSGLWNTVEVFPADLTIDTDVSLLVDRITQSPQLALLVNNAGFGTRGPSSTRVRLGRRRCCGSTSWHRCA